jgi:hypothetical protein
MSDVTYRNAMIRVSANGWHRGEPGLVIEVELTSLMPKAVEALVDAGISASDFVRGPGLPLSVFETIAAPGPQQPRALVVRDDVGDRPQATETGRATALLDAEHVSE